MNRKVKLALIGIAFGVAVGVVSRTRSGRTGRTYTSEEVLSILESVDVSAALRQYVDGLPQEERAAYIARHNAEREQAGLPPRQF